MFFNEVKLNQIKKILEKDVFMRSSEELGIIIP